MSKSFQEKSVWISLIAVSLIFGYYFVRIFQMISKNQIDVVKNAVLFISVVIMVVVTEIIFHIIVAVRTRPEAKDERDRIIELKATRNAYFILIAGVFLSFVCLAFSLQSFIIVHVIMFFFVLSEIAKFISQLFYYKRGV
jgi:hypothetical protein